MPRALRAAVPCALVAWTFAASARGDTTAACVDAVASGQKLAHGGQLRAARTAFLDCDRSACPAEVRAVCDRLVNDVEARLPTVVFGARDADGRDLADVSVRVDGAPLASSMDGKAVAVDPGPHVLQFTRAGSLPVQQDVVLREAEKNRLLIVTFPGPAARVTAAPPPESGPSRPVPPLAYVLGGVGLAALGAFIGLDVDGQSRYASCRASGCPGSLSAERDVAFATVAGSLVLLGSATWVLLARPTEPPPRPPLSLDVEVLQHGASAGVVGSF
jgi:hypothetical protein